MEGQGRSFPITRFTFPVRKVMGGGVVACRIKVSAPVPVPFLWTLDFGLGIWILDLDLGLDLGLTKIAFLGTGPMKNSRCKESFFRPY